MLRKIAKLSTYVILTSILLPEIALYIMVSFCSTWLLFLLLWLDFIIILRLLCVL